MAGQVVGLTFLSDSVAPRDISDDELVGWLASVVGLLFQLARLFFDFRVKIEMDGDFPFADG